MAPRQKEVWEAYNIEGTPQKEIAKRLGLALKTIRQASYDVRWDEVTRDRVNKVVRQLKSRIGSPRPDSINSGRPPDGGRAIASDQEKLPPYGAKNGTRG